ncbi:YqjD family protein [Hydrogenophaga sp.]|uniref:DUF883 family protein n=1 Tax=Hydrogenophaga sp. TaxID=1904254 RepID=UPI0027230438|nr:DUF883 family protein [Hydrogenophaga sp.]MDO9434756.1 DUF883 family protein [Hydrogenophaga sp.]
MVKIRSTPLDDKDKLVSELHRVIADAEELMRATAHQTEGKVAELRDRMTVNLREARVKLTDAEEAIMERTKEMARVTDEYVHENPWSAIGAAAGVGVLIGLLLSRR